MQQYTSSSFEAVRAADPDHLATMLEVVSSVFLLSATVIAVIKAISNC